MEDVLELDVDENEFDIDRSESPQKHEKPAAKWPLVEVHYSEPKVQTIVSDASEKLTLVEAQEQLLENLKKLEEDTASGLTGKPSVKSRLGVRETTTEVEFMDCSDSEQCDFVGDEPSDDVDVKKNERSQAVANEEIDKGEDIPRRPSMNKLRQRLRVKWHHSPEKIGKEIAERLQEPKYNLIINAVKAIGGKKAIELFNETKQIQLNGGMSTNNGSRRRTSGGVFLTLLKTRNFASENEIKDIFKQDTKVKTEAARRKRALQRQRRRERQKMETDGVENTVEQDDKQDSTSTTMLSIS